MMRMALHALLLAAAIPAAAPAQMGFVYFGDSLSDDGNAFAFTGGALPPSPPYFNGRVTNGPVWSELMPALAGGTFDTDKVYAFAGAQSGSLGLPPGLLVQVNSYLAAPGDPLPDDYHVVWIGALDYLNANAPVATVTANITSALTTLANAGAKRFIVPNLPNLGTTPRGLTSGNGALLTQRTQEHNAALQSDMPMLATNLGVEIILVDIYTLGETVTADPGAFGFDNVTDPCLSGSTPCATPDTYLYFDDIHPSAAGHELIAAYVAAEVSAPPATGNGWMLY
jgi:outer membrane lipase/esterase